MRGPIFVIGDLWRFSIVALLCWIAFAVVEASSLLEITSLEARLLVGEQRLAQLKDHVEFLRSIEVAATRVPR